MVRWMLAALVIGLGVLRPGASAAQTMFLQVPAPCLETACPDRRFEIALAPLAIRGERPVAEGGGALYVTPDGRYGVGLRRAGTASAAFVVTDLASAASFDVAAAGVSNLAGHPRRTEVFATDPDGVLSLSVAGLRRLAALSCGTFGPTLRALAGDGSRIAVHCGTQGSTLVLDTVSGAVLATLPSLLALASDGAHGYDISGSPPMLRRIALATGAEVGHVAIRDFPTSTGVAVEPRTGRVLLFEGKFYAPRVFEADLTFRQFAPYAPIAGWSFDAHRPFGVAFGSEIVEGGWGVGGIVQTTLMTVDTDNWSITGVAGSSALPMFAVYAIAWPPGAPSSLAATVAGTTVSLSWASTVPAAVTRYALEAGSAPGLANIATFDVGLQTSLAVGGVPPGTYYVRVRALNYTGASLPSNEVVVEVR